MSASRAGPKYPSLGRVGTSPALGRHAGSVISQKVCLLTGKLATANRAPVLASWRISRMV